MRDRLPLLQRLHMMIFDRNHESTNDEDNDRSRAATNVLLDWPSVTTINETLGLLPWSSLETSDIRLPNLQSVTTARYVRQSPLAHIP